jgi:peroxiredoxin Q/BCP
MTSGCTKEACQFRDHFPDFSKIKGVIVGVSPDGPDSHARFVAEHQLPFTLLADMTAGKGAPTVCDAYGVWQSKSLYGRTYMGVARTTYLIDKDGRVARRWDHVKVPGHVPEVLEAVKVLQAGKPLMDPDDRPIRLPRLKHHKKTRTHDTDPQYTPIRGGGGSRARKGAGARKTVIVANARPRAIAAQGRRK